MEGLLLVGGIAFTLLNVVCWIIILVNAWQDEIWKAIVGFVFWPYLLYFALVEFDHEHKWLIVLGWLLGAIVGAIMMIGGGMAL